MFDLRVDSEENPWLLEVGLFCSFGDASVINIMAKEAGISSGQLLSLAAENAIKRFSKRGDRGDAAGDEAEEVDE